MHLIPTPSAIELGAKDKSSSVPKLKEILVWLEVPGNEVPKVVLPNWAVTWAAVAPPRVFAYPQGNMLKPKLSVPFPLESHPKVDFKAFASSLEIPPSSALQCNFSGTLFSSNPTLNFISEFEI